MTLLAQAKWTAVPSWGCQGWDLGQWPLVVVSFTEGESATDGYLFGANVNTEGDNERRWFTTSEARERWVSKWAQDWYAWQGKPASLVDLSCLNGPYHHELVNACANVKRHLRWDNERGAFVAPNEP